MRKGADGFTLVELLVSVAILAILGTVLTAIMRSGIFAWREGEARTSTTATAQTVMDQLSADFAAAYTRRMQPPGTVTIEIPTVAELAARARRSGLSQQEATTDFYSTEWCTISCDKTLRVVDGLYVDGQNSPYTFDFRLQYTTRKARVWIATYGDVGLEAKIFMPDNEQDDTGWHDSDEWHTGDLSDLISSVSEAGTDHIAIRATLRQGARLMPGTEGPVLRFAAEPERTATGAIQFLIRQNELDTGGPPGSLIVFVRNFPSTLDSSPMLSADAGSSLGEVCYLTTFDVRDGTELPTGTLWRAVRQPLGDWGDGSLFDRDFIWDGIASLYDAAAIDGKVQRHKMAGLGFHPVAENVLYFGIEAWEDHPEWPGWIPNWEPSMGIPKKIRIILTLLPQTSRRTVARLAQELAIGESATGKITLDSAGGFRPFSANSALERYVKVAGEWVYYDNISDSRCLVFDTRDTDAAADDEQLAKLLREPDRPPVNRGLRGSAAMHHAPGTDVYQGETYVRTIVLPYPKQIELDQE